MLASICSIIPTSYLDLHNIKIKIQNSPIEFLLYSSLVTSILMESSPRLFMSSTVMYLYCCWSLDSGSSPAHTKTYEHLCTIQITPNFNADNESNTSSISNYCDKTNANEKKIYIINGSPSPAARLQRPTNNLLIIGVFYNAVINR